MDQWVILVAYPGPGDRGHNVESWPADCRCDMGLVLPEKAP